MLTPIGKTPRVPSPGQSRRGLPSRSLRSPAPSVLSVVPRQPADDVQSGERLGLVSEPQKLLADQLVTRDPINVIDAPSTG
jgi:hypothetical protein